MSEKRDRRVMKTRKALLESLTKLLETKDLSDITVKEITELSDINRGTFYLHYKDVFDMMEQIQNELFEKFNAILDSCMTGEEECPPYTVLFHIFMYVETYKDLTRVLMGEHGDYHYIQRLRIQVKKHLLKVWEKNNYEMESFEIYFAYFINGVIGMIQYWVESNSTKTPAEMAALAHGMIINELELFKDSK